nr:reverse transcriptase domain-containing protein [Tanacetum cinerariifolium]
MRIEQYFIMTDYSLWEVILNGDSPIPTRVIDGVVQPVALTTVEQRLARKNELKAHGTLLMDLPDKHQLKFNIHKDAKTLMETIEKQFGRNKETKKVQKTLLKQQYEKFTSSSSESLDQIHDRLTNESVSAVASISDASAKVHAFALPNVDTLSDAVIYSFFASLSNSPQLDNDDLKQIHADDLEEMNLKWQMAMLTIRARRLLLRIERNLGANGTTLIRNVLVETQRRNVPVETSTFNALVSHYDGFRSYGWSFQAEEEPTNYALMAFTSSSSSSSDNKLRDNPLVDLRKKFEKAKQERDGLKLKLDKFQTSYKNLSQLLASQTNDKTRLGYDNQVFHSFVFDCDEMFSSESDVNLIFDSEDDSEGEPKHTQIAPSCVQPTKHVKTPRPSVKTVEHPILAEHLRKDFSKSRGHSNSRNRKACFVCKSLTHLIKDCDNYENKIVQTLARNHAQRGNHQHYARMTHPNPHRHVVPTAVLTRPAKTFGTKPHSPPRRTINHRPSPEASNFHQRVTSIKAPKVNDVKGVKGNWGNPQHALKDKGVIDSRYSRHMTGNMSYLSDFEEINDGYVAFGGNPNGGKITGKGKIRTDTECIVLSPDFKLPDENDVLLRVPRKNNMYNVDLKNIVPFEDLTCIFAKATLDESNIWHRRLGHINFKTINKLVKAKNSSGKEEVNTASILTASTQVASASANVAAASFGHDIKKTGKNIIIQGTDVAIFDKSKVECFNCHKMGHLVRECRAPRSQDRGRRENFKQGSNTEEQAPKALMAIDGVGWDWSYMANEEKEPCFACKKNTESLNTKITELSEKLSDSKTMLYHYKLGLSQVEARLVEFKNKEIKFCEKIRGLEFNVECKNNRIERLTNELEELKKEKECLKSKLTVYSPPKKDMSWTGLHEFANDTITDYSRPSPSIETDCADVKTNKVEAARKPSVKYAKMYRNTSKSPKVRGNQRNWNNLMNQRLGSNFVMKNKACFKCGHFDHLAYDCSLWVEKRKNWSKNNFAHKNVTPRADLFKTASVSAARRVNIRVKRLERELKARTLPIKIHMVDVKGRSKSVMAWVPRRTPSIGFMRPFGYHVTILNTLDPLDKLNGKADDGFLVGYSVSSEAFRVFNSRTRIVQETLHINFLENQPNVVGSGPTWLFDIDTLTKSMNYQPLTAYNQPNPSAGIQEHFDVDKAGEGNVQQYVLFPLWSSGSKDPQSTNDDATFEVKTLEFEVEKPVSEVHVSPSSSAKTKKHDDKTKREAKAKSPIELSTGFRNLSQEIEDFFYNSINEVNDASTPVPTVGQISTNSTNTFSAAGPSNTVVRPTLGKSSYVDTSQYLDDPNMLALEDITYYDDEEDVGVEADFSNLETTITEEGIDYKEVFAPVVRIEAIRKGIFKAPPPMTNPVEKRNHTKFFEFHGEVGHNTDECMHLKKQIEEMLKAGKLSHLIKELKQNSGNEQPKATKKGETSRKDKALAILKVQPWERVARIGDEEHSSLAWMNFMVVTSSSIYNGIIGRPGVRKLQEVPSTAHKMLKLPVERGVIALKSSRERVKVAINLEYLEQAIMIGSTLTEGGRNKLCGLLQRNLDIFVWKPAHMTGVPRHIAEHRLNMQEGCSLVTQKKKGQAADRNHAIQEKVRKLVKA